MLSMLGVDAAARIDLLPKYILLRLHTDTHRNVEHDESPSPPDPIFNGIMYSLEACCAIFFPMAAGYRRAGRSFCEKCGKWKQQYIANLPPGNGSEIAKWLGQNQIANLATLPPYVPTGRRKQATLIALERCDWPGGEKCPAYLGVKDVTTGAALAAFDGSFGKLHVRRVQLTPTEVTAITPLFPQLNLPSLSQTDRPSPTSPASALVEVTPIPVHEANKVLSKGSLAIANVLGLSILVVFYGATAGVFVGIYFSGISNLSTGKPTDPVHLAAGLGLALISLVTAVFSGYVGLRNPGVPGNLYFRHRSRTSITSRKIKLVDPSRPSDLPTYFVQVIPRKNWGRHMIETATDTGFLQIDARRRELRFEGDVERYRIPIDAIQNCQLANYSVSAGRTRIEYWVVVIQANSPKGPWEAPIALRQTNWRVPADHRRQTAQEILDQITPLMADVELMESADESSDELSSQIAPPTPTPILAPRPSFFRGQALRLIIIIIAVAIGIIRAITNNHLHSINSTHEIPIGIEGAPGGSALPLHLSNVRLNQHLADSPPYFAPNGDWTIFDCAPSDDLQAIFTVAVEAPATSFSSKNLVNFSHAQILPGDRTAGAKFIADLAQALQEEIPPTPTPQPLAPLKIPTAVLGKNLSSPAEGLKSAAGTWVATKWFIQNEGLDAEIYFNYDLATNQAEFSEKDSDYNGDVLTGLAIGLRDGPRPPRTPQNDPNFTTDGPQITQLTEIPDSANCLTSFARGGQLLILTKTTKPVTATAVQLDNPTIRTTLAQSDGFISSLICLDPQANRILLAERTGATVLAFGANSQEQIWLIDRANNSRKQLTGPWGKDCSLAGGERSLSPDGRFAAIHTFTGTILDKKRTSILYLVNLQTGQSAQVAAEDCFLKGWTGAGPTLLAMVEHRTGFGATELHQTYLADPNTGQTTPASIDDDDLTLSPDKKSKFLLHPKTSVDITDLSTGQTKTCLFNPDDRRFAFEGSLIWLSPRYLHFYTLRDGFIDIQTMKMGYLPFLGDNNGGEYVYSPDFKWATAAKKTGITLGRVTIPESP